MIVKAEQIEALKPYIANVEQLVDEDDLQKLLDAIDDLIIDNIFENDGRVDREGAKLQNIYDDIFYQN